MSDIVITLLILAVAVVVFVWNRIPVEIVGLLVSLALLATGVIGIDQVFEGFASQTVVLIASLFIVAEAIDAAGITTALGGVLGKLAGRSRSRFLILIMASVALLTALISVNGAVAALLPMVVVMCVRLGHLPAKVLLPMAFAAHAGSLLVLTGSPVNVLIADAAIDTGQGEIDFFEFGLVGLPLLVGTAVVALLLGNRLLPDRVAETDLRDLSSHPRVLAEQYLDNQDLFRLRILPSSPVVGMRPWVGPKTAGTGVHVLSPQRKNGRPLGRRRALVAEDRLVVRGGAEQVQRFCDDFQLEVDPIDDHRPLHVGLISKSFGVAEVLVPPRSPLVDTMVYPGMVTESGHLVVLAHQRVGTRLSPDQPTAIRPGDTLLLQGTWAALDEHTRDTDVILIDSPDAIRRQTVPMGPAARPALIILALMVVLLTADIIPAAITCLMAAVAMVLTRVVTPEQARRSLQWQTLILIAAMIPLSTAITETGAAEMLANGLVDAIGGISPYIYLLALFLVTVTLGQLISNTATALIIIPIAVSVAAEAAISPVTVLMCISVASSAALMTPVATPANLMVMQPAGYRFGDYWKLGLAVMVVYLLVGVGLVPLIWPF